MVAMDRATDPAAMTILVVQSVEAFVAEDDAEDVI
jgi:hypothetical protein